MARYVLAVTTYNRLNYLKQCLQSWEYTKDKHADWTLIIADDGSTDGTLDFISDYDADIIILNKNRGIADQTNSIIQFLANIKFDVCFKVDDDIIFGNSGWDLAYYNSIITTGYDHLVYDNPQFNIGKWCDGLVLPNPVYYNGLKALVRPIAVKGCFYTLTPRIISTVGFMDSDNFFHGFEHTDYFIRCARAGFNSVDYPFDIADSNNYIGYRFPWDKSQPVLSAEEYTINSNNKEEILKKRELLDNNNRIYIGYNHCKRRMVRLQ